jgi:hypothetical protein
MHMPHEFGCNLAAGSNSGGDDNRDLGTSTGWTDVVYYQPEGGGDGLRAMSTDGTNTDNGAITGVPLSPVCALAH